MTGLILRLRELSPLNPYILYLRLSTLLFYLLIKGLVCIDLIESDKVLEYIPTIFSPCQLQVRFQAIQCHNRVDVPFENKPYIFNKIISGLCASHGY